MKKGFTLIELLAVLVVLAVIGFICVPIVLNIIENARNNSRKRSIDLYGKSIDTAISMYLKHEDTEIDSFEDISDYIDYNGAKVECDTFEITKDYQFKLSNCKVDDVLVENYSYGTITLKDKIISNYGGKGEITKIKDLNLQTTGLYKAEDDLGMSYFFRGNVEDNYVQFGEYQEDDGLYSVEGLDLIYNFDSLDKCEEFKVEYGTTNRCILALGGLKGNKMYWRIIRINGDGSIRLAYDGNELLENNVAHHTVINVNGYISEARYKENAGLKKWYTKHLSKKYNDYISDSIFCNDTEETRRQYFSYDGSIFTEVDNPTDANITEIDYAASYRLSASNLNPKLTCTQPKDRYTVNNSNGNGILTYPIGLLNADELSLAGNGYLNSSSKYMTMTPSNYTDYYSGLYYYSADGIVSSHYSGDPDIYTRPVINLKADVSFTGSGTIDDPYVIITE